MTKKRYWADLRGPEISALSADTVVVLPLGATEQHGPHLPMSVDSTLVDGVVERSLALLDPDLSVLILPTLSVTKSQEHDRHAGTLSLSADTLLAVLRDIGASVARAGLRRLVLLNGHGGNSALLEVVSRDLRMMHDMIVVHGSWFGFAEWDGHYSADEIAHDLHAGDIETSAMLAADPAHVDMTRAEDFRSALDQWKENHRWIGLSGQAARPGWIIDDLHAQGACGNAAAASEEKGQALLASSARNFAAFLSEFSAFDHRAPRA